MQGDGGMVNSAALSSNTLVLAPTEMEKTTSSGVLLEKENGGEKESAR